MPSEDDIKKLKNQINTLIQNAKPAYAQETKSAIKNLLQATLLLYKGNEDKEIVLSVALVILNYAQKHSKDYQPAHSIRRLNLGLFRDKAFAPLKDLAKEVLEMQKISTDSQIFTSAKELLLEQIANESKELSAPTKDLIAATVELMHSIRELELAKDSLKQAIQEANLSEDDGLRLAIEPLNLFHAACRVSFEGKFENRRFSSVN